MAKPWLVTKEAIDETGLWFPPRYPHMALRNRASFITLNFSASSRVKIDPRNIGS